MGKTLKWSYIPYELGHCSWKLVTINILNKGTMTSLGLRQHIPWVISKGHVIMKSVVAIIILVKFDIYFLELGGVCFLAE